MSYDIKQVIVMRRSYPDGKGGTMKLRTGKIAAQVAHASMAFIGSRIRDTGDLMPDPSLKDKDVSVVINLSYAEQVWFEESFAKVVCYVETEVELLELYARALEAKLMAKLITDAGATEFHGQPTVTALAIGPDKSEKIDAITGELKLL